MLLPEEKEKKRKKTEIKTKTRQSLHFYLWLCIIWPYHWSRKTLSPAAGKSRNSAPVLAQERQESFAAFFSSQWIKSNLNSNIVMVSSNIMLSKQNYSSSNHSLLRHRAKTRGLKGCLLLLKALPLISKENHSLIGMSMLWSGNMMVFFAPVCSMVGTHRLSLPWQTCVKLTATEYLAAKKRIIRILSRCS